MTLSVKVIWHLLKLCAIGFALLSTGSIGFSVFPFEEPFSSFPPLEEQKHDYVHHAAKVLNELAAQPVPGSPPPFESSPPGPEDVPPFPHQQPSMVSPTQSPPSEEAWSPRPNVSVNVTHSKEQESSAPTPSEVSLHDLAPPPVAGPLHDPPTELPAAAPQYSTPLSPLHASAPASISIPKHIPSLPPSAISPYSSVPRAPLPPSHVIPSSPPESPPPSAMPPPVTSSSPASAQIFSTAPPPFWPEHTPPPSVVAMPPHYSAQKPPAVSPHDLAGLTPLITPALSFHSPTPTHTVGATGPQPDLGDSTPPMRSHTSAPTPRAMPFHDFVSSPTPVPPNPSTTLAPPVPSHSSAPPPQTMPRDDSVPPHHSAIPPVFVPPPVLVPPTRLHFSAPPPYTSALPPDSTVSGHFSTPPPPAAAAVRGLRPQAMPKDVSVPPHPSAVPPTTLPSHVLVPPPAIKPHFPAQPPFSSAPPPSTTVSGHFFTPPPAAAVPVSSPPPQAMLKNASVPPHPSAVPPTYVPSHVLVPPPAIKPHSSASPPFPMQYISAPPPDTTVSGHFSTPPAAAVHVSGPSTPRAMPFHDFVSSPTPVPPNPSTTLAPPVPSHSSAPPPQTMPRDDSVPPHHSAIPPVFVPPPVLVPPTRPHFSAPPPYTSALPPDSTVSGHFSTPPPPAAAAVRGLRPQAMPKDVSVPPHPSAVPPTTLPSHVLVPPPTIKPHFPAQPPFSSAPPPSTTVSGHFFTPPPAAAVPVSSPPPQAMLKNASVPPHPSAVPPTYVPSHVLVPPPAIKPHSSASPPFPMQYISAPPPDTTVSGHFSTPPAAAAHVSGPVPQVTPRDASVPPHPSAVPPTTVPSHVLVPPPPTKPHVSAPPPFSTPYISAPPPGSSILGHFPVPPPPSTSVQPSAPPPNGVPSNVSLPPAADAPLHNSPPHFAKPHLLAPPPLWMHNVSAPLSNSPPSVNGSYPPSVPVPPHASAPSITAEPPFISTPSNVSLTPAANAPLHNTPAHVAKPHFLAPPPLWMHNVTAPLSNSPSSVNSSLPPSAPASPHASAPSTTDEPPLISSPPSRMSSNISVPSVAPPARLPIINPTVPAETPSISPERPVAQVSSPTPSRHTGGGRTPVAIAPSPPRHAPSPTNHHPTRKGTPPSVAPVNHRSKGLSNLAPAPTIPPIESPPGGLTHGPSSSPLPTTTKARHWRGTGHSAPESSYAIPSPAPKQQGHVENPYPSLAPTPESEERDHSPTHRSQGPTTAMAPSDSPSSEDYISPVPLSALPIPSGHSMSPFLPPAISPSGSSTRKRNRQLAPPILALPPPPPNQDCLSLACVEPYTNTIPGSPCGCVMPMKVELRIGVDLFTFFPLVPQLAQEVATGTFMKQSQVRIMGANAASEQPEKTLILIDLVPLGDKFDNITAFLIYERFWNKQVFINKTLFGDYQVLYVEYPGLPPSPPSAPSDITIINGRPYPGQDNGGGIHPLGVDVTKQGHKRRFTGSLIAIIVSSAVGAMLVCLAFGLVLLFRQRRQVNQSAQAPHIYPASIGRSTGPPLQSVGSGPSSSLSFGSSAAAYTGSAKTLSAADVEKATDNFDPSRVIGEGGFGRVYSGVLEDGTHVAVKVLKREDQQGGREFLAEVEMLSRLHHRNLVTLIAICVDERARSLIYELVSNGSVESHLHGIDRETSPLDWAARMKIALGAARGLAYLHEDSSPRVIHRDFKASNILLEPDFTPKVSDFGLARTAMDEENMHISTRVMGTFGYVAPEYAMTGHLLVKSDVYSYGVVLLELLTGRKPVDMSQPPGQENLVAWMRPFLTNKEALRSILDPYLGEDLSFDSVAKVAAIASMCVQPEVSHRPFMGEVVQALKLVCNECDETKGDAEEGSPRRSCSSSHGNLSDGTRKNQLESRCSVHSYFSGGDVEKGGLSTCDVFDTRETVSGGKGTSRTFYRRHSSSSGPLRGRRGWRFWQRGRRTTDNGEEGLYRFWSGSH